MKRSPLMLIAAVAIGVFVAAGGWRLREIALAVAALAVLEWVETHHQS